MADPVYGGASAVEAPAVDRMSALRQYLVILRRRRVPIVATILICLLAAVAYSIHKPKLYNASAQVVISRQNLANALTGTPDPASYATDFATIVQTQADIARSPAVAQNVAGALPQAALTYKDILNETSVTPTPNADILTFSATDRTARLAVQIVNAYAVQFVAYTVKIATAPLALALKQTTTLISRLQTQGNSALVSQLIAKEQQLQELSALQTSDASVTGPAVTAAQTSPQPVKYIALALIGGTLLAIGFAWALEALDTRVRSADELEERLGLPLLGHIPPPPRRLRQSLLMLSSPHSPAAEAFRLLRGNLQFMTLDRGVRTFMVTSAVTGDGKSTTIANLAVTMARTGATVVLVDLDLRRPALDRLFSLSPGPGITDVAVGRATLPEALFHVELADLGGDGDASRQDRRGADADGALHVLRAGVIPPDPAEFVVSPSVSQVLDALAAQSDVVLIDAPPLLSTSDAAGLCRIVDGVFVVARLPMLTRPMVDQMRRALTGVRAVALGFVLTGQRRVDVYGARGPGYGYRYTARPDEPSAGPPHTELFPASQP